MMINWTRETYDRENTAASSLANGGADSAEVGGVARGRGGYSS
jgi:hypothetical protein